MDSNNLRAHWDKVFTTKGESEVSWFQETPSPSLELLGLVGARPSSAIIDVGGGTSRLVDALVGRGFDNLTVLDISDAALSVARERLGDKASRIKWIAVDVTKWQPAEAYDIWHDRAVFHFLTDRAHQAAYVERSKQALRRGGHVIIGTFALDGPEKCSGLPVARQSAKSLAALLGSEFVLIDSRRCEHSTPWRTIQKFQFSSFRHAG
jgi:SAM-dependent methyltransferase